MRESTRSKGRGRWLSALILPARALTQPRLHGGVAAALRRSRSTAGFPPWKLRALWRRSSGKTGRTRFRSTSGLGVGVADRLEKQGLKINRVNFGGKPVEPPSFDEAGRPGGGPLNRRAEMWLNLKNVLGGGRFSLPDSDSLMADLCSVGYRYDSAGRLLLESKDDLRKRGMPSPDEGDAVALCFTEPGGVVFHRAAHLVQEPDLDWVV